MSRAGGLLGYTHEGQKYADLFVRVQPDEVVSSGCLMAGLCLASTKFLSVMKLILYDFVQTAVVLACHNGPLTIALSTDG